MSIFKTETKKSLQIGTHILSKYSKLRVLDVRGGLIDLSFADCEYDVGWTMDKEDVKELIEVLSEIYEVME